MLAAVTGVTTGSGAGWGVYIIGALLAITSTRSIDEYEFSLQ